MVHLVDMIGSLSDGAFAMNAQAQIVAWSPGAQELLGFCEDDVIGKRCGDILKGVYLNGEPLCTALCDGQTCFENERNFSVNSCLFRHKDGQMISVKFSGVLMPPTNRNLYPAESMKVFFMQETVAALPGWFDAKPLRIFTLGHFSMVYDEEGLNIDSWTRKQALAIFKYLVTRVGHPVHRENLIETFWPEVEPELGWKRLKVEISYLRRKLRACNMSIDPVVTIDQSYMLRKEAVWIDSWEFEKLVADGHKLEQDGCIVDALTRFEDAKRLYGGDYLEDAPYADWCARERERLSEFYFEMLAGMSKCKAALGDYVGAAQCCRDALYRDQSRESFLRSLIECLAHIDRADWAKPQLEIWHRMFSEEFDIVPKPEHLRLYQEIIEAKTREAATWNEAAETQDGQ